MWTFRIFINKSKKHLAKRRRPQPRVVKPQFRVNDNIRVPEIRLVGDNLEEISESVGEKIETGIFSTHRAKKWAEQADLDLIEISPNANPPVCKITDYQKFLYQKKKREKELKSKTSKTELKEVRFGPNIDDHDFSFKLRHAKKFLEEGNKLKAYVHFKGRTIIYKDRGMLVLLKFIKELEDFGTADELPKMEGRRMLVMISPKKGPAKKKK